MPDTSPPGIQFKDIHLLECEFKALADSEKLSYNLELTHMSREVFEKEDGSSDLVCIFHFDLMHDIEDPCCLMRCSYGARYFRTANAHMGWNEFTDGIALSHVLAYVREFVMNITTRSTLPRLFLDPINAYALVAAYNERQDRNGNTAEESET
jgi:hypothetical protein